MNNKRKGNRKELLVKNQYEKAGWIVVKSGASLSPFDLICFKFDAVGNCEDIHVLQIKSGQPKTLKYNVVKEELEFKKYVDSHAEVKFKFIKLLPWQRFRI